jgi:predicted enzyme related to lactoylglutathione lyase
MAGEPTFIEIGVPEGAAARVFYEELFGWQVTPMGNDNFMLQTPTVGVGVHSHDDTKIMEVFFAVPDLEAAMKKVVELGGQTEEPRGGGEYGRFVECVDDQGVRFGLHEPAR